MKSVKIIKKKKWQLFALGFVPLVVGYIIDLLIMRTSFAPGHLLELSFLLLWGGLNFRIFTKPDRPLANIALLHLPLFLALLLVLIQELVVGHYWINLAGIASQYFYLPVLIPASSILSALTGTAYTWLACGLEFIMLLLAGILGVGLKLRQMK